MAEERNDGAERTEPATPKRLEDARKRGQIARSRELNMTAVMLVAAVAAVTLKDGMAASLGELMRRGLAWAPGDARRPEAPIEALEVFIGEALLMLLPLLVILLAAAILGPLAMGGWAFSLEPLKPKLSKLNPLTGLKRVFGWNGLVELLKALAKFLLVAVAAVWVFEAFADRILRLPYLGVGSALAESADLLLWSFAMLALPLVLIAAADVPYQRWDHARKLRMTKQEVRDEQKETEGRPEVRGRIRQQQQELARRRMMEAVATADVVATNPTHYAVALRYDGARMRAPRVVAKGRDLVAQNIRRVAEEHGVPVFEHPPLARALYGAVRLGEEIPQTLYVAVAQVLTYVHQLQRFRRERGAAQPQKPEISLDEHLAATGGRGRSGP
jgi:flagellar biosynthetic protein FlhB